MDDNFYFALGLATFAGLSTGIGSLIAFFARKTNKTFLSLSLGFSAGVMIYVSFVALFPRSLEALSVFYGSEHVALYTGISFFAGVILILIIDALIPKSENPHEAHFIEEMDDFDRENRKLLRIGFFTAIAIAIHNFPEGIATFAAGMEHPTLGISIATAISIHNIPEGIAISIPIYFATGSRKKAFWISLASGLSEPLGALVSYFAFPNLFSGSYFGFILGAVAGIMVFISLGELIPAAREYDTGKKSIYGLVSGMFVMAITLIMLGH